MREIRFRGKRPDGSWAYGDLTHKTDGCYIEREMCAWWVDKDTVGQFTGLKDKNGVDIYEGDIVEFYTTTFQSTNFYQGLEPHLEAICQCVKKCTTEVRYSRGMFTTEKQVDDYCNSPLDLCGINDVKELSKAILGDSFEDNNAEEWYDGDGAPMYRSMEGIEVVGDIHANPQMIK